MYIVHYKLYNVGAGKLYIVQCTIVQLCRHMFRMINDHAQLFAYNYNNSSPVLVSSTVYGCRITDVQLYVLYDVQFKMYIVQCNCTHYNKLTSIYTMLWRSKRNKHLYIMIIPLLYHAPPDQTTLAVPNSND